MLKIIYTQRFKDDLIDIKNYISIDNVLYAIKTINSIKTTIEILKIFPKMWKISDSIYRIIIESKYKYKIFYRIENDSIFIVSVSKYRDLEFIN